MSRTDPFHLTFGADHLELCAPRTESDRGGARVLYFHGYGQTPNESLSLGSELLSRSVVSSWIAPRLPGHADGKDLLEPAHLLAWAQAQVQAFKPDWVIGYSLGARVAMALDVPRWIGISPPVSSRFEGDARTEVLRTLRPRCVRESGPMRGLAGALDLLPIPSPTRAEAGVVLIAQKDLMSIRQDWSVGTPAFDRDPRATTLVMVRETDHLSICVAPACAQIISDLISSPSHLRTRE